MLGRRPSKYYYYIYTRDLSKDQGNSHTGSTARPNMLFRKKESKWCGKPIRGTHIMRSLFPPSITPIGCSSRCVMLELEDTTLVVVWGIIILAIFVIRSNPRIYCSLGFNWRSR